MYYCKLPESFLANILWHKKECFILNWALCLKLSFFTQTYQIFHQVRCHNSPWKKNILGWKGLIRAKIMVYVVSSLLLCQVKIRWLFGHVSLGSLLPIYFIEIIKVYKYYHSPVIIPIISSIMSQSKHSFFSSVNSEYQTLLWGNYFGKLWIYSSLSSPSLSSL